MEQLRLPEGKDKKDIDWIGVYEAARIMKCSRQNVQKHQKRGKFQIYWKDDRGRLQLSKAEVRAVSRKTIPRGQPRKGATQEAGFEVKGQGQKIRVL